jgi:hypothetical protein
MGQSKPPAGVAEQRDAGIVLDEPNPSRDHRQGELYCWRPRFRPVSSRVQMPPGRTAHGLPFNFPQSNPDIIRFYFRRLCATLRVKQER